MGAGGLGAEGLQEESSAFRRWVVEEGAPRGPRVFRKRVKGFDFGCWVRGLVGIDSQGRELGFSTLGGG